MQKEISRTMMTLIENPGEKKLQVDFDGCEASSDGGVLFLREVERRMKLLDRLQRL